LGDLSSVYVRIENNCGSDDCSEADLIWTFESVGRTYGITNVGYRSTAAFGVEISLAHIGSFLVSRISGE